MLSDAILACKDLPDLARLFLGLEDQEDIPYANTYTRRYPEIPTGGWPTNNGAVLRHIFKLLQDERDPEALRHVQWYADQLTRFGFRNIPMSGILERRAENQKVKDKLVWFPPGMEPE